MKFRIWFEPMDIEINTGLVNLYDAIEKQKIRESISISKILPIDEDGFPIEQPKIVKL